MFFRFGVFFFEVSCGFRNIHVVIFRRKRSPKMQVGGLVVVVVGELRDDVGRDVFEALLAGRRGGRGDLS